MVGKSLKVRIVMTFVTLLAMAMCMQSMIFLFLGVRSAVKDDIAWAMNTLQSFADISASRDDVQEERQHLLTTYENFQDKQNKTFSCFNVELVGLTSGISPCLFSEKLLKLTQQVKVTNKPVVVFADSNWNFFLVSSDMVLFAVPLKKKDGQIIGTISAEHSLLPIYSRYKKEALLAVLYLFLNTTIFSGLSFFRMDRILFRPLERLVQKAENYKPDQDSLFLVSNDESAFRKLSTSLNTLLDRIERDNHKLRLTVTELEAVNRELKEKIDLVVRSEKLASVGRLSAGLAHEIGNPLSIILGYVELLRREDLNGDERNRFSERAQMELDRIKRLIRQLLDFAGTVQFEVGIMAGNDLIEDVITFVALEKSFAGCSIITELSAEHDKVLVDKDAFRQVLINCLFNAADATIENDYSHREIVVITCNELNDNNEKFLVVTIKDNGVGINEEHFQNIFDPFFTTKEVGRGTGLGLFVCHTIMERLGGKITLSNKQPSGIEVRLVLPSSS